ncbi:MAG: CinA family nicotinamide mononucleotide deamidase-related protein [Dehalococcoidales bacterium]|jgi:nicotinamide-nucleotide amidase
MNKNVKAEIISIGTELLRGEITDTNAVYIASQLPLIGIELQRITTSGDDIKKLAQIIRQSLSRSSVIITTGGLGPTQDDLTREAIALVLDEELFTDQDLVNELKAQFIRMGREMPLSNLQQAMRIPSAASLPNPRGTAPGWWVEKNGKVIAVMPGPPREMLPMWQNEVLPRLKTRFPVDVIQARTIKTFSMQEAKVGELVQPYFETDNLTLGIYAKPDGIQLRLIAKGSNASHLLDVAEKGIKEKLAPYVWGTGEDTLEGVDGQALSHQGLTLATIEQFTGGLLGHIISNSTLSLRFYRGGIIVKSDLADIGLGFPVTDPVSGPVAEAMAQAIKDRFSADIGLSITGVDCQRALSNQSDVVYVGVADAFGTKSWTQQFMINRSDSVERAAVSALFHLRERLIENKLMDYVK